MLNLILIFFFFLFVVLYVRVGTRPQSLTMLPFSSAEEAVNETAANLQLNLKPETLYINEEPIRSTVKPVSKSTVPTPTLLPYYLTRN